MDYTTHVPAEEALGRTQAYFTRDWPYGGRYRRNGNEIVCTIEIKQGCLGGLFDFLLTVGTLFIRDPAGPKIQTTRLLAYPKDGATALSVTADVPEHASALEAFLVSELGAKPA